ncbi:MAG TPA: M56 family metallopeptidase [Vicinamibacterales bacterium]|nr:M56 family metallopeptidase [Vicinamibacterales bacterium]
MLHPHVARGLSPSGAPRLYDSTDRRESAGGKGSDSTGEQGQQCARVRGRNLASLRTTPHARRTGRLVWRQAPSNHDAPDRIGTAHRRGDSRGPQSAATAGPEREPEREEVVMPIQLQSIANHVWQSTLFGAVVGLVVVACGRFGPRTRYGLWLAASAKFLIPFSLLSTAGRWFGQRAEVPIVPSLSFAIEQVNEPFSRALSSSIAPPGAAAQSVDWISMAIVGVWAIWTAGALFMVIRWVKGIRQVRAAVRDALPQAPVGGVPVRSSPAIPEPSVVGVFRPVILLPHGIDVQLTPPQLESVLLHEMAHVRRRDNLTGLIHRAVEVLFWFHPLIWWIGARLSDERERACDDDVLGAGIDPKTYAEGILRICELYLKAALPFATGMTASSLTRRIETIMTRRAAPRLTVGRKAVLVAAACVALASPFVAGLMAQTTRPQAVWTPASGAPAKLLTALEGRHHDLFIDRARAGNIDLVFFGGTDTEMWSWRDSALGGVGRGHGVWDQAFGALNAANFGSQGTHAESLLWRMQNGELDGYEANLVVLHGVGVAGISGGQVIGNLGDQPIGDGQGKFIAAYARLIAEIRARQPQAKILLSAPFPRGRLRREEWKKVADANAAVYAKVADEKTVFYVNFGDRFFRPDGSHNDEMWAMSGPPNAGIHEPGFKAWADALQPWLDRFVR